MYDNRRLRFFPTTPEIDIYQIIREAQTRWLRPVEVIEILRNFQKFRLNPVPPNRPPSGSLFLFDRKTLRFFRKDGHNWRKKKDGKTVREAHERLKAGSIDVLHCYYAHGEDNANFQRRSYWMLEGAYEHIVLVHYREVTEGSRSSVYRSIQEANANKDNVSQTTTSAGRPALGFSASPAISDNTEVTGPYKSPEVVTTPLDSECSGDEHDDTQNSPVPENQQPSLLQQVSATPVPNTSSFTFLVDQKAQSSSSQAILNQNQSASTVRNLSDVDFEDLLRNPDAYLSPNHISPAVTLDVSGWKDLLENFRGTSPVKIEGQPSTSAGHESKPAFRTEASNLSSEIPASHPSMRRCLQPGELQHMDVDAGHVFGQGGPEFTPCLNNGSVNTFEERRVGSGEDCYKVSLLDAPPKEESSSLKKMDSFGRWMSREIGEDSQSSLLSGSSDHGAYWTLEDHTTLDEISSFSHQMNLDVGLSPSVSHDQQFSIADFSPEWAFSSEETKVIVAGNFLKAGAGATWHCMFGEVEVPAEIIHEGALRCKAPPHAPGRVPFYITRGDRLACSEIRDFEYRVDTVDKTATTQTEPLQIQNELLQMRFAKLTSGCPELDTGERAQCEKIRTLTSNLEQQWIEVEKHAEEFSPKERVIEILLMQQLQNWLLCKLSEDGKGPCILDAQGQGALHLAAALGYDWAIAPILASGVVINYRDSHGWTALHWAATFGRENVVSTLLAFGASPGLVTDPTPKYPAGRTPADLAANSGHKGMAGYLAEMSLTSHLTSLTLKERQNPNEIDSISAVLAEEKAVESISEKDQNARGGEEQVLLQDSLRAVRNAARAAALIHASFRQESFKRRQEKEGVEVADDYGMSLNEVKAMSSLQAGHRKQLKQNTAATKIQQKFRGWKGRRDYLLFRQRVVKIQAHVRGHQVRRKFKSLLWTVSILDKAVLRWRRKGAGLRNARAAAVRQATDNSDDDEVLRAGRKQKEAAVEKAVTRVQSMVRSHQAREQYQRIQDAVKNAVAGSEQQDDDTNMAAAGD